MPHIHRLQKVVLCFSSARLLWQFYYKVAPAGTNIDLRSRTLVCECFPDDIELAEAQYGATVILVKG